MRVLAPGGGGSASSTTSGGGRYDNAVRGLGLKKALADPEEAAAYLNAALEEVRH